MENLRSPHTEQHEYTISHEALTSACKYFIAREIDFIQQKNFLTLRLNASIEYIASFP